MTTGSAVMDVATGGPRATRRRMISIFGACAGLSAAGLPFMRGVSAAGEAAIFTWEGNALGAQSTISLAHYTREGAERIVNLAVDEIRRLEQIFSLQIADSELSTLNRDGRLTRPSHDMLVLLTEAKRYSKMSEGAFDVTVQPLWTLYREHFLSNPDSKDGPSHADIDETLRLVNYRRIEANPLFVRLDRDGMQLTLNGIAQGYITDKVSDLLRENGLSNVLVSLGETRALDGHPEGRPWLVALADPMNSDFTAHNINLTNMAVATSGGYGTEFDRTGRYHHLFDPRVGESAWNHVGVSVIAPRATTADALSTALYVLPPDDAENLVRRAGAVTAILTKPDGTEYTLQA